MEGSESTSEFQYIFTESGHLCHRDTREPYKFSFKLLDVQGTMREHQALSSYVTQHVSELLEKRLNLVKMPLSRCHAHPASFVYMNPGALRHRGTLLVLIQDRGTVGCGVWSCRAVVHAGLDRGSQIPYVCWALRESCAVVLMNPNGGGISPEEHVLLVWDQLLLGSAAERIAVVAHGYGGLAFVHLLCRRLEEIEKRRCAMALIDSSHSLWHQPLGPSGRDWLKTHSTMWVLSAKQKNRPVGSLKMGCRMVSAGTQSHEAAPAVCMESVFRFFGKLMKPSVVSTPFSIVTRSRSIKEKKKTSDDTQDTNNNPS